MSNGATLISTILGGTRVVSISFRRKKFPEFEKTLLQEEIDFLDYYLWCEGSNIFDNTDIDPVCCGGHICVEADHAYSLSRHLCFCPGCGRSSHPLCKLSAYMLFNL